MFSNVSGSAQMMEMFSNKQRSQRFEPHWYCEAFCGFPMIDCHQGHGLSSSTHVLLAHSHWCIHGIWKILYGCCTVIWTPLENFHSKQMLLDVIDVAFYTRHWVRHSPFNGQFGVNLQLDLWLMLSFVLFSTWELCFFMMFSTLMVQ